jgi:hypothetical protein
VILSGQGLENTVVRNDMLVMVGFAAVSMPLGILALHHALVKAHKGNGVGMVV